MKVHRTIWIATACAVLVAVSVVVVRNLSMRPPTVSPPAGGPVGVIPAGSTVPLVKAMFARLARDPEVRRQETRKAIEAAAALTADGSQPSAEAYYALGLRLHRGQGAPEKAEAAYRKAIALRPDWAPPHDGLGYLLHTQERKDEAEKAFLRATELDPAWSKPHNDLAVLYRLTGRWEKAEAEAQRALELAPESLAANNNFGNLLVVRGHPEQAEERYRKAIELAPDYPKPYYNLACVYALLGRKDEALGMLEKAVALDEVFRREARDDTDLGTLHGDPRFEALVERVPAE